MMEPQRVAQQQLLSTLQLIYYAEACYAFYLDFSLIILFYRVICGMAVRAALANPSRNFALTSNMRFRAVRIALFCLPVFLLHLSFVSNPTQVTRWASEKDRLVADTNAVARLGSSWIVPSTMGMDRATGLWLLLVDCMCWALLFVQSSIAEGLDGFYLLSGNS